VDRVDLRLSPPANPEEGQNEPTCRQISRQTDRIHLVFVSQVLLLYDLSSRLEVQVNGLPDR